MISVLKLRRRWNPESEAVREHRSGFRFRVMILGNLRRRRPEYLNFRLPPLPLLLRCCARSTLRDFFGCEVAAQVRFEL